MKFVDTTKKAKEREAMRKKIQDIQAKEIKQDKFEEALRAQNRKMGQLSLTETTLSQFIKKPKKR